MDPAPSTVRSVLGLPNVLYCINKLNLGNLPHSCHVSLILPGLILSTLASRFCCTIIKQMFYREKHLTLSYLNSNPYVAYEGVKRTTHKQPHWPMGTMCVSVCVPRGPLCVCWVRGDRGFNKGTGLVQGSQSDRPGTFKPDGVQMRATRSDFSHQTNSRLVRRMLPAVSFPEPLSQGQTNRLK